MRRARIIAIVGPDGSGKSTQAKRLADSLRADGHRVKIVYGRIQPRVAKPLVWAGLMYRWLRGTPPGGSLDKKDGPRLRGLTARLFSGFFRADMLLQGLWRLRLGRWGYDFLVCDRYVHDTLMTDLAFQLGWDPGRVRTEYDRIVPRWLPEPDLIVFLRVRPDVAMARKDDIESSTAYHRLAALYVDTRFPGQAVDLDSSRGIELAAKDLYQIVQEKLGGGS